MRQDLIGQKFGRLTIIAEGARTANKKRTWICRCDCGNIKIKPVVSYDLKIGKVRSCGCLYSDGNKGNNKTHGMTGTRLYRIWSSMRQRCLYSAGAAYNRYGGRGVTIYEEWNNFQTFYEWAMVSGYDDNLTLDRIDVNGNYCPENCRWATMKEQQNNRSNNIRIAVNGEEKTISEWSEITGIPRATLEWRIKNDWADNELFMPVNLNNARIRKEQKVC